MSAKALIVGIAEYANPANNLPGVNNDVPAILKTLATFGILDVEVLRDSNATSVNILKGMNRLVADAKAGDVRIFYFSGHGTLLPPGFSGSDDPDGRDEALVPYEGTVSTLILDNAIGAYLKTVVSPDVSFWGIYDSCHSGDIYKAAVVAGLPAEEQAKELQFKQLVFDGFPARPSSKSAGFTTKALILDGSIPSSFHFGAAEAEKPALCLTISGVNRSAFTWAFAESAIPGLTVSEFETAVSAKLKEVTDKHHPQIACAPQNKARQLFS